MSAGAGEPMRTSLLALADRCVKCGLCLEQCPTYGLTRDENESPRGRIGLIQGWAQGALQEDPVLYGHLDRCLLCRRCERICPALVDYAALMDGFRAATQARRPRSLRSTALRRVLRDGGLRRRVATAVRRAERWGLRAATRHSGLLRLLGWSALDRLAPRLDPAVELRASYPALGGERGRVGLHTGCLGSLLDCATLEAAIHVLRHAGYAVEVPPEQGCCGALDWHAGDVEPARALARANLAAFGAELDAVVSVASGCGAMLQEYPRMLAEAGARAFSAQIVDIGTLLWREHALERLPLQPLRARVLLHQPCSLRNALRAEGAVAALLSRLPGIELIGMPESLQCCGSAGTYMLEQPELAARLREPLLAVAAEAGADYLATSNIGCALHLREGLLARGLSIEVVHPVTLLARCLPGGPLPA